MLLTTGYARGFLSCVCLLCCTDVLARGASPYLPLNMSPDLERKIERVMLLGDKPVLRRPIAAATVLDALPQACRRDKALCEEVRSYLNRYMRKAGVTHFRTAVAATDTESTAPLPNEHGQEIDSSWAVRAQAYYQLSDYLALSAGGIATGDDAIATDSMISFGADFAQLDVGYRDHWLSPLNDSSTTISTEAPTMLSATLSNYSPLTPLGITYEVFLAEMSRQEGIVVPGGTTSGNPCLAGLHAGVQPADGYAFAVTRITQYGGGARGSCDADFFDALFEPSNTTAEAENSNRVAAITSSILFQGTIPFGVHLEYAGDDNAYAGNYRLGATNFSRMFVHILPNVSHVSLVQLSQHTVQFIKAEVILSFLGFGVPVDMVSWGTMLAEAQNELVIGKWWQLFAAGASMALLVTAFSLLTDSLRDALDPKLK